jgi:hypothetical protein
MDISAVNRQILKNNVRSRIEENKEHSSTEHTLQKKWSEE